MNNMSDMSFTQTSRAMTSSPLNRASNSYKPWWEVVSDYNKDTKRLKRVTTTKCKNPSVFMGY
ncbi:hypothetical protein [Pseudoalteromonas phage Pq0]|uniref:hypothetical protein n=1 Tax=Pseudoalteromonas phage Pq0 TaxID=1667322 RepID=UPI000655039A|nr:hypothetical protein AXI74_gp04 [Pseudoalteromonas phage Pq0]AKN44287.1 hypothetical protein [Pseudoalteromonas phage Pq0]